MDPLVIILAVFVVILMVALGLLYVYPQSCPGCECESNTCPESNTESLCTVSGYTKVGAADITISKSKFCEYKLDEIRSISSILNKGYFIKTADGKIYSGENLTKTDKKTIDTWITTAVLVPPIADQSIPERLNKIFMKVGVLTGDSSADSSLWRTLDDETGAISTSTGTYKMLDQMKAFEAAIKFLKEEGDYKKYC